MAGRDDPVDSGQWRVEVFHHAAGEPAVGSGEEGALQWILKPKVWISEERAGSYSRVEGFIVDQEGSAAKVVGKLEFRDP